MTTTVLNTNISEVENKITNHDKYITAPEVNSRKFCSKIKVSWFSEQIWYWQKLINIDKKITSNGTNHLEVQKRLNSLTMKDYNFLLGRIYFISDVGFQNKFVCQPTFNVLELKIDKGAEYIIGRKPKEVYNYKVINLYNYMMLFYLT